MWDDQFQSFAEQYQVIRYDCRGFGKSALPTDGNYSPADDLGALLDNLGIDWAYVVGLSMGGYIAVDFALTYPESTAALIPVDAALGGYEWTPRFGAQIDSIYASRKVMDHEDWVEVWLKCDIFDAAMEKPQVAARLREIIRDYSACHLTEGIWWSTRAEDPPATARLSEIAIPALVIVGEKDSPDFHRIAGILREGIPGARKVVIPGAGHVVNMECPDEFNRTVLDFLRDVEVRALDQK
jgi:pimeloyl-ACP methyl ester carboxylesterase